MEIVSVVSSWFYTPENGEECEVFIVGAKGVTRINETKIDHPLNGTGRFFVDVDFGEKKTRRLFNIDSISYEVK